MDIKFQFRNLEQVTAAAAKAPDVFLRNMVIATKISARDVQNTARAKHRFRSRSGLTELAIDTNVLVNGSGGIVGEVFLNEGVSSWGRYVHEGTKPHVIRPRNKKWLRWPAGSGFRFAKTVMHPGTKPDQFIYEAGYANQAHINDVFNRYVDRAAREVGL